MKTTFDIGPVDQYPLGIRSLIAEVPAMLIHSASGFTALSLVCTHLGCTVEQKDGGFACPCHGSQYDVNGNVLRGPAQKPLRALRVEITADKDVVLHTD